MKKILVPILIIALVLGFVGVTAKNNIVKVSVEKGVEIITGLKLTIEKMDVGIITTLVGIKDLKLFNPPQFQDRVMLDMPEIYVDYNLPEIIRGKVHLNEVRIDLAEFMVVKNRDGELNLDSLNVVKEDKDKKPADPAKKGKAPQVQIDSLQLKVGSVVYKDYSKGGEPSVTRFDLNLNEKFSDIDDPAKIVSLIVVRALANTTIARLANFDIGSLQNTISGTLQSTQKIVGSAQEVVAGVSKTVAGVTSGEMSTAVKDTAETAKATVQSLSEAFKNPFATKEE